MNQDEFQTHVIDTLARLDTKMEDLVGNGKPGRVAKIEAKVESLDHWRWVIGGGIITISAIIHFVFKY